MNNNISNNWLGLDSSVCVITGAAGGIGVALAQALVEQKAHVVLLDRDIDKCRELAATLSEHSDADVSALACDIADPLSVQQAADQVQALYGRCDVLINNASVLSPGSLESIGLDQWNQVIAVNLSGYLLCSQAFGRLMLASGKGSIVHIASIAAHYPNPIVVRIAWPSRV